MDSSDYCLEVRVTEGEFAFDFPERNDTIAPVSAATILGILRKSNLEIA
jgi:hypothetical protein